MPERVYTQFGVAEVVNGVGYATRVAGSCPHPDVLQAMTEANTAFVEIDDLQAAASRVIARCTGAEAGLATCGASAALTLAAAACLAGNNPDLMDRLPDVSDCPRREVIYPRPGPYDYDHAVRTAGARLVIIDYDAADALEQIEAAIGPRTAAIGYVWLGSNERPAIDALADLAHRHSLPLVVDAALSLPPVENLRSFVARGADLVAYSGGKHLGGPQNSGILCGRADLVRSAWLQMVDMDVRPGTWSLQRLIDSGWIRRPPRHGIGRSMKVGKDSIIGLLMALERYGRRDHAAELSAWRSSVAHIADGLADLPQLEITQLFPSPNGQPYPVLQIKSTRSTEALSVRDLILALAQLPRKVLLAEDERSPDICFLYPMCLRPDEPDYLVTAIGKIIKNTRRESP
jgi:L-seryl-tRNA(Ser) seleniumtransferase